MKSIPYRRLGLNLLYRQMEREMKKIQIWIPLLLLTMSSCTLNASNEQSDRASETNSSYLGEMVASYYGAGDQTNAVTASGERFDPQKFTAAHTTLPFGTQLKVRNPENGKFVIVRVNDRGPFKKGRDIDLTKGAATALGLTNKGVSKVEVSMVE